MATGVQGKWMEMAFINGKTESPTPVNFKWEKSVAEAPSLYPLASATKACGTASILTECSEYSKEQFSKPTLASKKDVKSDT